MKHGISSFASAIDSSLSKQQACSRSLYPALAAPHPIREVSWPTTGSAGCSLDW